MTKKKIWIINILCSLTVLTLMTIFRTEIQLALCDFLISIFKPISVLSTNPLDLIILSSIPIWTYPLYSKHQTITGGQIIRTNLIALVILILTCVIAFIAIDGLIKPTSPWIPEYVVIMPFTFFPTVVLLTGVLLTYLVHYFFRPKKTDDLNA